MSNKNDLDYVKDLPGYHRGNPVYFNDPMIDKILEIIMVLSGELWVEKDRRIVTEYLLSTKGEITSDMIENFKPDQEFKDKLKIERKRFTENIFNSLYDNEQSSNPDTFFSKET